MAGAQNHPLLSSSLLQPSCLALYVTQGVSVLGVLLNLWQTAGADGWDEAGMHVSCDFSYLELAMNRL